MNTTPDTKLDAELGKLARDLEPARDLWPGIAARIGERPANAWPHIATNLAAAAAVVVVAVIIALTVVPGGTPSPGAPPLTAATTSSVTGTSGAQSDPRALFMAQLARDTRMPANARSALLENLQLLGEDISRTETAVKKYPDDVNLRTLLFNLYQQQARLLDEAQRAQIQTSTRTAT